MYPRACLCMYLLENVYLLESVCTVRGAETGGGSGHPRSVCCLELLVPQTVTMRTFLPSVK